MAYQDLSDNQSLESESVALQDLRHRNLHWTAIRLVCRKANLDRNERRRRLRFFLEGLARSRQRRAEQPLLWVHSK